MDVNHSNSGKQYKEQIRIVSEVLHSRNYNPDVRKLVKGVMIESYLLEGRQDISDHMTPGCSITDPCLGWEDTERLLYDIAENAKGDSQPPFIVPFDVQEILLLFLPAFALNFQIFLLHFSNQRHRTNRITGTNDWLYDQSDEDSF